ncbi:MAG TPA: hypothetical protein VE090_01185 [Methylomirabilota bacterium]|nr:hypothetical protein [Methylomirabilota bacterium]
MIKRIILSLLIIIAVSGAAFAGTRALLSDQATLAASTFSTGTVDLRISNSVSTSASFADSQPGFTGSLLPGQTQTKFFRLRNLSSDTDFSVTGQAASISGTLDGDKVEDYLYSCQYS